MSAAYHDSDKDRCGNHPDNTSTDQVSVPAAVPHTRTAHTNDHTLCGCVRAEPQPLMYARRNISIRQVSLPVPFTFFC